MKTLWMWLLESGVPACVAGLAVYATIDARHAFDEGRGLATYGHTFLSLALFSILFTYLRWAGSPAKKTEEEKEVKWGP